MDGTILGQGTFTQPATAIAQTIAIPSGCDWLKIWNYTQANQATSAAGPNAFYFHWQRGMGTQSPYLAEGAAGAVTANVTVANAFVLYDPSQSSSTFGAPVAITSTTNAVRPVVATGSTAGLVAGSSIVRLSGAVAVPDIMGVDFVIDTIVANTSFRVQNALATAPGAVGGAGFYRILNYQPLFYPRRRIIASISQALQAVVVTTVPHGYTVGQELRFNIPQISGMIQLNSTQANNFLAAIVVSVTDANTFVINIDTTAFTAFTFPTAAQMPGQFPEVTPIGEDTATALNAGVDILADATVNTGFLGMTLATGALLPAGVAADVVYWVAGKSTYGGS
jgi:hypothetical protein